MPHLTQKFLRKGQGGRRGRVVVRENMPKQLTEMLQICFERFRAVVSAHEVLLSHFQRTKRTYKGQSARLCEVKMMLPLFLHSSLYTVQGVRCVGGHPESGRHPLNVLSPAVTVLALLGCRCKVLWRCIWLMMTSPLLVTWGLVMLPLLAQGKLSLLQSYMTPLHCTIPLLQRCPLHVFPAQTRHCPGDQETSVSL